MALAVCFNAKMAVAVCFNAKMAVAVCFNAKMGSHAKERWKYREFLDEAEINQLNAPKLYTSLFTYTMAPTCFGKTMPSSCHCFAETCRSHCISK
jgi:hypothetical protein